jgi:hypothetical protein
MRKKPDFRSEFAPCGRAAPLNVRENCRVFVGHGFSRAVKPEKSVRL